MQFRNFDADFNVKGDHGFISAHFSAIDRDAGLYLYCPADARNRDWGERCDFQCYQRSIDKATAVSEGGKAGWRVACRSRCAVVGRGCELLADDVFHVPRGESDVRGDGLVVE